MAPSFQDSTSSESKPSRDADTTSTMRTIPLAKSIIEHEATRTASLQEEGKQQMQYPKSNEGFFRTFFMIEGRALDWMFWPWLLVVLHAVVYTVLQETYNFTDSRRETESWELVFRFAKKCF